MLGCKCSNIGGGLYDSFHNHIADANSNNYLDRLEDEVHGIVYMVIECNIATSYCYGY